MKDEWSVRSETWLQYLDLTDRLTTGPDEEQVSLADERSVRSTLAVARPLRADMRTRRGPVTGQMEECVSDDGNDSQDPSVRPEGEQSFAPSSRATEGATRNTLSNHRRRNHVQQVIFLSPRPSILLIRFWHQKQGQNSRWVRCMQRADKFGRRHYDREQNHRSSCVLYPCAERTDRNR